MSSWFKYASFAIIISAASLLICDGVLATELPHTFFAAWCVDCHQGEDAAAHVDLDELNTLDWSRIESFHFLERVLNEIKANRMPPDDAERPKAPVRKKAVDSIFQFLMEKSSEITPVARRLNRREYANTIRDVLGIDYELPVEFPTEHLATQFDTAAEQLTMSAPLMEAYFHTAIDVADTIVQHSSLRVTVAGGIHAHF